MRAKRLTWRQMPWETPFGGESVHDERMQFVERRRDGWGMPRPGAMPAAVRSHVRLPLVAIARIGGSRAKPTSSISRWHSHGEIPL